MNMLIVMIVATLLSACSETSAPVDRPQLVVGGGVAVKDVGQELRFERRYRKAINDQVEVEIVLKNEPYLRDGRLNKYAVGSLRQRDGKHVQFPLHAVAENIVQEELVAPAEQAVAEIIAMDHAYIASDPREFVDTQGHRWVRGDK